MLLFRRKFERSAEDIPWIAALADRRLAAAMTALLDRPSEAFTVEALARIAGMSRSAFASLFKALQGYVWSLANEPIKCACAARASY